MPWKITKNHLDPEDINIQSDPIVPLEEMTVKFRLYDADDNLYFEGVMHPDDQSEREAFAPLGWAMGYAGCTYMKLLEKGKWNIL